MTQRSERVGRGFQIKETACRRHRGRKELIRLLLKRMKGVEGKRDGEMAGLGLDPW